MLLPYAEAVSGPLLSLVRLDRGWAVDMGECLPHVAEALRKKEGSVENARITLRNLIPSAD